MKQTIFITTCIILILTKNKGFCQGTYYDSLLIFEEKVFSSKDSIIGSGFLHEKLILNIKHSNYAKAYNELKRIERYPVNVSYLNKQTVWNNTLLSLQVNDFPRATSAFRDYYFNYDSLSIQSTLLGFLVYINIDSVKTKYYLNKLVKANDSLACLKCFYEVVNYKERKGVFNKISSIILPGSGLVFMGKPIKGIIALSLSTAFVASSIILYNYKLYVNLLGWGIGWGTKFYFGQIHLTQKEFNKKQDKNKSKLALNCKFAFENQLKRYNINYILLR